MPMYLYRCEECSRETGEIRKIDDRDRDTACGCGGKMKRVYTADTSIQIVSHTGWVKTTNPKFKDVLYERRYRPEEGERVGSA